jgi:hypothetical protein
VISAQLQTALQESPQEDEAAIRAALQKYRGGATPQEVARASGVALAAVKRILRAWLAKRRVTRSTSTAIAQVPARGRGAAVAAMAYKLAG